MAICWNVTLGYVLTEPDRTWEVRVFDPNQDEIALSPSSPTFTENMSNDGFVFHAAIQGIYTAHVTADLTDCDDPPQAQFFYTIEDSNRGLFVHPSSWASFVGEHVGVSAFAFDRDANPDPELADPESFVAVEAPAALSGELIDVRARVIKPPRPPGAPLDIDDGLDEWAQMYDDGAHLDGAAGDGVFGLAFVPTRPGRYGAF